MKRNKIFKVLFLIVILFMLTIRVNAEVRWEYVRNPKYVADLRKEYYKIPQRARDSYDKYDMTIRIYGYNVYSKWAGLFTGDVSIESYKSTSLKKYFRKRGVYKSYSHNRFSMDYAKSNLIHELGHAYDYQNGWLSDSAEFISIFKAEKNKFKKTGYFKYPMAKINANINTPVEYFASSFDTYVRAPKDLKKRCPKTYRFFENQFKNYITP